MVKARKKYIVENTYKRPEDGKVVVERYETLITGVEDRGDYLYISHRPVNFSNGRFGAFRIYKTGEKRFGTKVICEAGRWSLCL